MEGRSRGVGRNGNRQRVRMSQPIAAALVSGALVGALAFSPLAGAQEMRAEASANPVAAGTVPTAEQEAAPATRGPAGSAEGDVAALKSGGAGRISLTPSITRPYWVCPKGRCNAIVDPKPVRARGTSRLVLPDGVHQLEGGGEEGGYDPQDLQSAYDIPTTGGAGETIGIVDANGFPGAESALAVYRERYGLPPCTHANGCFRKVNGQGQESNYPKEEGGWKTEQALDIEMVSAACPECRILLVQSEGASSAALDQAENTAVRLGAIEVSNSWGNTEQNCNPLAFCEEEEQKFFDHPGVMIFFAAGDHGYDNTFNHGDSPDYPASLPSVIAVGGTALHRASNARGWSEETWYEPGREAGGGSGCSRFPKPSWQVDPGCPGRMTEDVAADAACETPLSVYDGAWKLICGTSASSPLLAGIEAHVEEAVRQVPGAEAFYEGAGAFNDVTRGVNGECPASPAVAYFCRAEPGYDGPTGVGTPEGPLRLLGAAPTVATWPVQEVGSGRATLHGYVSPHGIATSYWFEYGTTTAYGASAPVPEGSVGESGQAVAETVGELQGETVYHYRLVARNADGTTYGPDYAFSTGVPSVATVTPATGSEDGGETVRITGANLTGATLVHFGSREPRQFEVESDRSISATATPGTGLVQVTVTTPAGTSVVAGQNPFVYNPLGPVLSWGIGALGDGETQDSDVPVEVTGLDEARALSSGWWQGLALTSAGSLMAWGASPFGEIGDGTYEQRNTPVRPCAEGVAECPDGPYLEDVTQISAGRLASLALLSDGTVAAWGGNLYGDLATDTERNPYPLPVCTKLESPCQPENYLREVVEVAAGADYGLALLKNGTVVAWGENVYGTLGDGTTSGPETCGSGSEASPCSRVPVHVSGLSDVKAIAAGAFHALALLDNGSVMAWGENEFGELGDDTDTASSVPQPVCAIGARPPCKHRLERVKSISPGDAVSFALLENGTVAGWGWSGAGSLGDIKGDGPEKCQGVFEWRCSRVPLLVKNVSKVRTLAQGERTESGLVELEKGNLETWGSNFGGVLGNGTPEFSGAPVGVCAPLAAGPCPEGPYLQGEVTALASGSNDLVSLQSSSAPLVDELYPSSGPPAGGTTVTVFGGNLLGATAVNFGTAPAERFEAVSGDELVAVAPPGSGLVNVTVTTPEGTSVTGAGDRFVYGEGPPAVATGEATGIGNEEATLNGSVNPLGAADECRFEYGSTPAYGSSVACASLPENGNSFVPVSATVTKLKPDTTYYFRAVASNARGTTYGLQETFGTAQPPELGRCEKRSGAASGSYSNSRCTSPSAGGDSGRYEWVAGPGAGGTFTAAGGAFIVERLIRGKDRPVLECSGSSLAGVYAGEYEALLTLTLTGCSSGGIPASSAGAASGEIVAPLRGELQKLAGPKGETGLRLANIEGEDLLTYELSFGGTGLKEEIAGSITGTLKSTDKMSSKFSLTTKSKPGVDKEAAFKTKWTIANGEPLEVKASV